MLTSAVTLAFVLLGIFLLQCNGQEEICKYQPKKVPEGRSCRKSCKTNEDCKGGSKSCNCDDVCGMSCFNPNAECIELEKISNGKIDVKSKTYNSVAEYSCKEGFTLRGKSQRKCQSDRKWSGNAPECVEESCKYQPKKIPEGRSCRKQCQTNDDCKGGSKACNCDDVCGLSCFNLNAECDRLEEIANGTIDVKGTIYNSVAEYSSREGFTLRGESRRKCQSDRKWSGNAPECVETDTTPATLRCSRISTTYFGQFMPLVEERVETCLTGSRCVKVKLQTTTYAASPSQNITTNSTYAFCAPKSINMCMWLSYLLPLQPGLFTGIGLGIDSCEDEYCESDLCNDDKIMTAAPASATEQAPLKCYSVAGVVPVGHSIFNSPEKPTEQICARDSVCLFVRLSRTRIFPYWWFPFSRNDVVIGSCFPKSQMNMYGCKEIAIALSPMRPGFFWDDAVRKTKFGSCTVTHCKTDLCNDGNEATTTASTQ